ncbi:hypothetical protein H4J50_14610 [Colwellia sp. 6M3]|jgi:hypothetical protein|uniref:hypothetical protein n=1 Tax=Colwellia sp. 6M3 TaxID=2759849 RepID=UPI0015F39E3C|nr:hypothetical protein [Colwellia sp. 6M3]MBA6417247.1 hypothetical protein [Colwellia sp. 6M3]|tara:strand:+ start:1607 stop:1912 length:306 start_codon:yes stop_codon:yes gene_type:complete
MNSFSLKTLSITVVAASLVSSIVFAGNDVSKSLPKMSDKAASFSKLVADYDMDKNNTLSIAEVAKNDMLTKNFAKIDANSDQEISEEEFNQYLANMKKSLL